jgi:hypothetical protein
MRVKIIIRHMIKNDYSSFYYSDKEYHYGRNWKIWLPEDRFIVR